MLGAPGCQRHLVSRNPAQALAAQLAQDAFAGDLLPPASGLLVDHEEILVVDADQMEAKDAAVYRTVPHQTGVTERSIGGQQRRRAELVIEHVMGGEVAHRIRAAL